MEQMETSNDYDNPGANSSEDLTNLSDTIQMHQGSPQRKLEDVVQMRQSSTDGDRVCPHTGEISAGIRKSQHSPSDVFNESLDIPDELFDAWCADPFIEDIPEDIESMIHLVEQLHAPHADQERSERDSFVAANRDRADWVITLLTQLTCADCNNIVFSTQEEASSHALTLHEAEIIQQGSGAEVNDASQNPVTLELHQNALGGAVLSFRGNLDYHHFVTSMGVFNSARESIREILKGLLAEHHGLKVAFQVNVNFLKPAEMNSIISKWLNTHNFMLLAPASIDTLLDFAILKIEKQIEKFQEQGSGLIVANIADLHMTTCIFQPSRMGTYQNLPPALQRKLQTFINVNNSIIELRKDLNSNIESEKNMCFAWSVLAALYPIKKKKCQVSTYRHRLKALNLEGIEWPMTIEQIPKFEKLNPTLCISVFFFDSQIAKNSRKEYGHPHDDNDVDLRGTKRQLDTFPGYTGMKRRELEKYVKKHLRDSQDQDAPVTDNELVAAEESQAAKVIDKCMYPVYVTQNRPGECNNSCVKKCPQHPFPYLCTRSKKACPPKACATHKSVKFIDLLLLETDDNSAPELMIGHFVTITDLSNLFTDRSKHEKRRYFCRFCLQAFTCERTLSEHIETCAIHGAQKTKFSTEWKLHFEDYSGMNHAPHVIYADFEAFLKPTTSEETVMYRKIGNKRQYIFKKDHPRGKSPYKQEHKMCGYAYAHIDYYGQLKKTEVYHTADDEEDVVVKFLNEIIEVGKTCLVDVAKRQQESYYNRTGCPDVSHICYFCETSIPESPEDITNQVMDRWYEKIFLNADSDGRNWKNKLRDERFDIVYREMQKVVHHCHYSHEILGNAHSYCNMKNRFARSIVVPIHNLSNYDGHPILQALGEMNFEEDPSFIPLSSERFISLELPITVAIESRDTFKDGKKKMKDFKGSIRFIDSFRFLSTSLASLTEQLANGGPEKFSITTKMCEQWSKGTAKDINLLLRKGVFPYSFLQNSAAFTATSLPNKDYFTSDLSKEKIKDEDYEHAHKVWNAFGCTTFGDYHDLYCLLDVCLLADIMENFRSLFEKNFGLDPVNYVSLPSVSWQAALKYTKIELDYIKNSDIFLFFEKAIIGGLACGGSLKHAKANNQYVEEYDSNQPLSFIQYLDATNLYGTCLSLPLPTGNFTWDEQVWTKVEILNLKFDDPVGYTFEVDLEVPHHLMDYFDDYPLAPVKRRVDFKELSEYQKETMEKLGMKISALQSTKLIADLHPKEKYVLDYRTLQLYLQLGLVLTKVHKVLRFEQSVWLKPYIDWCTIQRQQATSDFEKDFFKLQINCIYGKTVENTRKRARISVWRSANKAKVCARQASLTDVIPISDKLVLAVHRKPSITLNRPIYVGVTCLSLAKYWMYDFYYNYVKKNFPDSSNLIFTDTDSLCIKFDEDPYPKMYENKHLFDMSDFSSHDSNFGYLHDPKNKKVRGTFKDECAKIGPINEFVFLKPKMYSYTTDTGYHGMRAKGVPKVYLTKSHKHDTYVDVFLNNGQTQINGTKIVSNRHKLYTIDYQKKALNTFDSKRFMLDRNRSYAFGNPKINN